MHPKTRTPALLALAGVAIIALAAPQVAGAASSAYPKPSQARSFEPATEGGTGSARSGDSASRASLSDRDQ